jgi:endonuclease IV
MSFGCHVNRHWASPKSSITAHIKVASASAKKTADFTATAAAIFVGGPRTRTISLNPSDQKELKAYISQTGLRVIAHSAYVAYPWEGKDARKVDKSASVAHIHKEMSVCQAAGIEGLVVHLPKQPKEVVLKCANSLIPSEVKDVCLYLETPATTPRESYYDTPAKLADLFRDLKGGNFGLCIDTAHLWTNGVDVSSYSAAQAWITELEKYKDTVPNMFARLMIHCNDSKRDRGKGPDAHEALMQGRIWESYRSDPTKSGLAAFVAFAVKYNLPVILERNLPELLASDYLILRKLGVGS